MVQEAVSRALLKYLAEHPALTIAVDIVVVPDRTWVPLFWLFIVPVPFPARLQTGGGVVSIAVAH